MRSTLTTNLLLLLIAVILSGSIAVFHVVILPLHNAICYEANLELAREYRAAEQTHAQQWESHIDKFFVLRCNTDQGQVGGK
jgi:hypothetical protein